MVWIRNKYVGNVLLLLLDNPPVNALGASVRAALAQEIARAAADAGTIGIVIGTTRPMFSAGADIREFEAPALPSLRDVVSVMDACPKPLVAAIDGYALGGGLELALACDARIVTPMARLGLPEVKLGLIPGAQGTQRLPRLIGAVEALSMMLDGETRTASAARSLHLIDEIAEIDTLQDAAIAAVHRLAARGSRVQSAARIVSDLQRSAFESSAAAALTKHKGEPQVAALVQCVRAAFERPLAEGVVLEREFFSSLLRSEASKALRHAFSCEQKVARAWREQGGASPRTPERVVVIGGGTMGTGIAMAFLDAGTAVILIETDLEAAGRARSRILASYGDSVRRNRLLPSEMEKRLSRLELDTDLARASEADLVVEAVFEDISVKKNIIGAVSRYMKPGTALATNTSYLDINEIGSAAERPDEVLGMHFFSPAHVMKLVEIVEGRLTRREILFAAVNAVKHIAKIPVVVGVCHGFVGNRMLARRSEQVDRLLLEGASPAQIDSVLTDFGFRMGPCAMSDLAGLDISWSMRKSRGISAPAADALCRAGRFGQKNGRGYYDYSGGARAGRPDPEALTLIAEAARQTGIGRRSHSSDEILARLLYPLINEGARILEEGIVASACEIDVIWLHGYNWPRWRGGPMFHANQIGLDSICTDLERFSREQGDPGLAPSRLLFRLAETKARLSFRDHTIE